MTLRLGSKIRFDGEDREGNPYIIAPICLVHEWHNVEPFSLHPDSDLSGGFYVSKKFWQRPVSLPMERESDKWVVTKDVWNGEEKIYSRADDLYYSVFSYKRKLLDLSNKTIRIRKITKNFYGTSMGIYSSIEEVIKSAYKRVPRRDLIFAFEGETFLNARAEIDCSVSRWDDGYDYSKSSRRVPLKTVAKLIQIHRSVLVEG